MSIIEVKNLSKKYRILHKKEGVIYSTIRDELTDWFAGKRKTKEDVSVLKNVSFDLEPGEIIGIIGPNGAGKTTLLKILSRITPPTEGKAIIKGRVGSLLEVGVGFHPELTGRENIYLNGAILGMRKSEINKKFDEIVEFAEIRKFLDTPVKRYSSGMYVRLAFSVAAHLETDILLVDEVLAVGDAIFQKKSLGRMKEVTQEKKRTIIFVSHNMEAVQRLCNRTILLNKGKIVKIGPTEEVISYYLKSNLKVSPAEKVWHDVNKAPGDNLIRFRAVRIRDKNGRVNENINIREPVNIEIEYWNMEPGSQRTAAVQFFNEEGVCLFLSSDLYNQEWRKQVLPKGLVKAVCKVPGNLFAEGRIFIQAFINTYIGGIKISYASPDNVVSFNVFDPSQEDGLKRDVNAPSIGLVQPILKWENSFKT